MKEFEVEARELELYVLNTYNIYTQYMAVCRLLAKKKKKGIFDGEKAVKAFVNLTNSAAKKYAAEFGGMWYHIFPPACRKQAAAFLLETAKEDVQDELGKL